MRKKIICMMLLITMVFVIPANAASTRAISVVPDIEFDGTEATCTVSIIGDRTTDEIEATMELRQGAGSLLIGVTPGMESLKSARLQP